MEITACILPLTLIFPGYCVIKIFKIKTQDTLEKLFLSYVLSLSIILGILYLGANFYAFNISALICITILLVTTICLFAFSIKYHLPKLAKSHKKFLITNGLSPEKIIVISSIILLLSIYAVYLFSRAILDSDVVHEYLPIARQIIIKNGFTYNTGYDYNIFLKPIGISVLYAWAYTINGSVYSEAFRLMPLIPILMLILLNYKISFLALNSKIGALTSSLIFILMPFHDRLLLYNAFYPDTFYYPLIFISIYYLVHYYESKSNRCIFWIGLSLGVASLFKAQTIYFITTLITLCISLKLTKTNKIPIISLALTPFYLIIPVILDRSIQSGTFVPYFPNLTQTQLILYIYISTLTLLGILIYIKFLKNGKDEKGRHAILSTIMQIGMMALIITFFICLWYIPNYLRFGALISTSNIGLKNFDWALSISKSLTNYPRTPETWQYLTYFATMLIDPALMGYVMLIPFLAGLFYVLRNHAKYKNIFVLMLFTIVSTSIILSQFVLALSPNTPVPGYNPRDILPLAPFITSTLSIGFIYLTEYPDKHARIIDLTLLYFLVTYFGLLNYVHSVNVYSSQNYPTLIGQFSSALANMAGLNLQQTSFQISYENRPIFIGENLFKIFSLSLIAALPIFTVTFYKIRSFLVRRGSLKTIIHSPISSGIEVSKNQIFSAKGKFELIPILITMFLLLSVIILPRMEILMMFGGPHQIDKNQLRTYYGELYDILSNRSEFNGGILAYKVPNGLPYYLSDIKIIDLAYPANLAYLRESLTANSPNETVEKLKQQGIKYLLVNPSTIIELDNSLNNVISELILNPELTKLSQTFGNYALYEIGPYQIEKKNNIPLYGWLIDPQFTNTSYKFYSDTQFYLEINPTDKNSRVTISNYNIPKINLSCYDFLKVKIEGSSNALVMIRFLLNDGTGFDFVYWQSPNDCNATILRLEQYRNKKLDTSYISIRSTDMNTAFIKITEISFIEIKNIK